MLGNEDMAAKTWSRGQILTQKRYPPTCAMMRKVEVELAGMKRSFRRMQGQITAVERLLEAGGGPLSEMLPENRRWVTIDSPALLIV